MKGLDGVLLLTAGYGERTEPLSLVRPKALLPCRSGTLLSGMAEAAARLGPGQLAVNASRCPELVVNEVRRATGIEPLLLFEERPLGAASTLAALSGVITGTWMLMNTDMVLRADLRGLVESHNRSGALCTVLCGDFPRGSAYGSVTIRGAPRHYMGVCVIEPEVVSRAVDLQGSRNLLSHCIVGEPEGYEGAAMWMDMGEVELYRRNLLSLGGFVHPGARVSGAAELTGSFHVSRGCVVEGNTLLSDSVMLEGSFLEEGAELVEAVLPWFSGRSRLASRQR